MNLGSRKAASEYEKRREQLAADRLRAPALRQRFPEIGRLRIELGFEQSPAQTAAPSAQLHTLYRAAPAFFRFSCPCAGCDGEFDLTDAVTAVAANQGKRSLAPPKVGELNCQGIRFGHNLTLRATCSLQLRYTLQVEFISVAKPLAV